MKLLIPSLNDHIRLSEDFRKDEKAGVLNFPKISMKSDANTAFEFDDRDMYLVTFVDKDANGKVKRTEIDLSKFELTASYLVNIIKPIYDKYTFINNF